MFHQQGAGRERFNTALMPRWQQNLKRAIDIVTALAGAILLSPLIIYARSGLNFPPRDLSSIPSKGYVIRANPLPFTSSGLWSNNAEEDGLDFHQQRIADHQMGQSDRKWRIDELPQFWNILKRRE